MDKTGTLTEGDFKVNHFASSTDAWDDKAMLKVFASLEQSSSHPLARSIVQKAKEEKLELYEASEITNLPGVGLEGVVNGTHYRIVNGKYLKAQKITFDEEAFNTLSGKGNSVSYLINEANEVLGVIAQGDQIKDDVKSFVQGVSAVMLTGDNQKAAESVAKEIDIDEVQAELLPEDKERISVWLLEQEPLLPSTVRMLCL